MYSSAIQGKKIINDPVYGFINIPSGIIFKIIEHPYFQRLRRIKQLGLTYFVFPGAIHTRFQHALGSMHLMEQAIQVLMNKGHVIDTKEAEAVLAAILLHDIGHGPFSHVLEKSIIQDIHHEELTLRIMEELNAEFGSTLDLSIEIFTGRYKKKFLHQLVSGQLDMDRMDYLQRDSFFTGVTEGVIGVQRIIKMLNVKNDRLVVEEKGIYSIEKFLIARRLMYWQVYLHKTALAAEIILKGILNRARFLIKNGERLECSAPLLFFLANSLKKEEIFDSCNKEILRNFIQIDDMDIDYAIKQWSHSRDQVLSDLCGRLLNRRLFRVAVEKSPFREDEMERLSAKTRKDFNLAEDEIQYYFNSGSLENHMYTFTESPDSIDILMKTGELVDIAKTSDMLNITALSNRVKKYYLCFPKSV